LRAMRSARLDALPTGTACHTGAMAKKPRAETAAGKGGHPQKPREPTDPGGDIESVDPAEEATKRRRIAGERRTTAVDAGDDSDTATKVVDTPESTTNAASKETPEDDASDSSGDSEARARDLAAKPRLRTRMAAPAWATLTGLIVGGVLTGLVYAGMQTFQVIYNTPAGDGVGAVVLVAVLIVSMLIGRFLLKWRGLHDPNATTLLG